MRIDDKWVYIDAAGRTVLDHSRDGKTFRSASFFCGGLASVLVDEGCGYIDKTGAFVIAPNFLSCGDFCEGLAPARSGDMWGFIDKSGAFVIEPRF